MSQSGSEYGGLAGKLGMKDTTKPQYICDFSLALVNRTGAFYVGKDLTEGLSDLFLTTRYWRFFRDTTPNYNLFWKIMGRLMLQETHSLRSAENFRVPVPTKYHDRPTVFCDPLYVLRADLKRDDVVLCHDVGPISHSFLFDARTSTLYHEAYEKIRNAKCGLVFVSQASCDAFTTYFGDDYRFLKAIPLFTRIQAVQGDQKRPLGLKTPFTLSVGAYETRKNYPRIIEAFAQSGLSEQGYSHVICGPRGHGSEYIVAVAEAHEQVHLLGRVSDAELRWLYANASGFVLPSLLEGFGVPVIEAAYRGLPSVVSANTAQQEAVNGHAICVDPMSVEEIAEGFRKIVALSVDERQDMVDAGVAHAKGWTREDYLAAWRDVLLNSPE